MSPRRFARQATLPEVGPDGQARLGQARVAVPPDGLAAEVAARYLEGAGVEVPRVPGAPLARAPDGLSAGPAEVAAGALTALVAVRAALGLGRADDALRSSAAE